MSIYSFPTLFVSVYTFILGLFVIRANPRARLNQICFSLTTTSFVWLFSYGLMYVSSNYNIALTLAHIGHISAVLIVPTVYFFLLEILGKNKKSTDNIIAVVAAIASIAAALLCIFSSAYMKGLSKHFWGYYPVGGIYMMIYAAWTFFIAFRALFLLNQASKKAIKELRYSEYQKFKFHVLALIVFIFAAMDYLPKFNVELYPFGFVFVGLFSSLITYAIIRHNLLNVQIVIRRSFVYSILISLITISYLIIVIITEHIFKTYFGYASIINGIVTACIIAVTFNPVREYLQRIVDKHFFKIDPDRLATENSLLKVAVRDQDRLKSVATLAAGMAHEIKNPLTSIRTFAEFLPKKYDDPEFRNIFSKLVVNEVDRVSSIVQQLLDFSKPTDPELSPSNVSEILDETLALLTSNLLKARVDLSKDTDSKLIVLADRNQVKQALLNLFLNAIQSMTSGGLLTITTKRLRSKSVIITITDTGAGINNEHLPHIFDPFYTTKEGGTGLGLAIVHSIITKHGGKIDVQSTVGIGTTVTITLKRYMQ